MHSTVQVALQGLVTGGLVKRMGKGVRGNPYLYYKGVGRVSRAAYMQAIRYRRQPARVWPRIVRKFLGPRKTWGKRTGRVARREAAVSRGEAAASSSRCRRERGQTCRTLLKMRHL